jgi:hypothetical protein
MYARAVRFTGADAEAIEANVAAISGNPEPPEESSDHPMGTRESVDMTEVALDPYGCVGRRRGSRNGRKGNPAKPVDEVVEAVRRGVANGAEQPALAPAARAASPPPARQAPERAPRKSPLGRSIAAAASSERAHPANTCHRAHQGRTHLALGQPEPTSGQTNPRPRPRRSGRPPKGRGRPRGHGV